MLKQFFLEKAVKQKWKKMQISSEFNVKDYLERIPKYFDANKAADRELIVVYEFHDSGDNDGAWTITIDDGECSLTKGAAEEYDTLIYMTAESYGRIISGKLDYLRLAYSTGAVRYFGNTLGHRELNSYLSLPRDAGVMAL